MNERIVPVNGESTLQEAAFTDAPHETRTPLRVGAEALNDEEGSPTRGPAAKGLSREDEALVVWFPEGLLTHPYCELLYRALARQGVERRDATGFWVWGRIRPARGAVFHIHWADHYVISGNRVRTLLKISAFTLELLMLRARGVRIVWTVHNLKNHENALPVLDRIGSTILAHLATSLIFHCEAGKRMGLARFRLRDPSKCHVIPHGHFIERYGVGPTRAEARAELGLAAEERVYLVFGLIRPYKGLDRLLEVFEKIREPGERLLIVGGLYGSMDRGWPERARKAYPSATLIIEKVPDQRVPLYFRAADVGVFPYRDILTSGAMILAMGYGLPCVAPRAGCIEETLAPEGNVLFDPEDDASLGRAIETMREKSGRFAEMGAENARRARDFDWDEIAERTIEAYRGTKRAG